MGSQRFVCWLKFSESVGMDYGMHLNLSKQRPIELKEKKH